jgi:spore coat protein U-like protein
LPPFISVPLPCIGELVNLAKYGRIVRSAALIALFTQGILKMFIKSLLNKTLLATSAAAFVAMIATPVANAGTATANLNVSATVQSACAFGDTSAPVSSFPLAFGIFSIGGPVLDVTAPIAVDCAAATPFSISAGGTAGARTMSNGGAGVLNYDIYTDAARTIPMGSTVGTNQITDPGFAGVKTVNIYGRIPQAGNLTAPLGTYTDVVVLTLSF